MARGLGFCKGTYGVVVTPCPAEIRSKAGIVVNVSGPGAAYAQAGTCEGFCRVKFLNPLKAKVAPLHVCGKRSLTFSAFTSDDVLIGYYNLKVVVRYCPA